MADRAGLGPLDPLGAGGSGNVFSVARTGEVYKELNDRAVKIGGADWAERAVAFLQGLSAAERAYLEQVSVWPTEVVTEAGRTVGVLMPRIPAEFWHDRTALGKVKTFDNAVKWLMQDRNGLDGRDLDVDAVLDPAVRFALLAQLGELYAWLHARDVVVGDISAGNAVFALNPPRILMLDCDAVSTDPSTNQGLGRVTLGFELPEHEKRVTVVTKASDVFKFALIVLRVLAPGPSANQLRRPQLALLHGTVPPRLVRLLDAALDESPAARPSMAELATCLAEISTRMSSPPVAIRLEILDPVVRRGEAITVHWDFDGMESVAVVTPDGILHDLDPVAHAHGVSLTIHEDGLLAVHASNRHGTSTFPLGPVVLYDAPIVAVTVTGPRPPCVRDVRLEGVVGESVAAPSIALPEFVCSPVGTPRFDTAQADRVLAGVAASGRDAEAQVASVFTRGAHITQRIQELLGRP